MKPHIRIILVEDNPEYRQAIKLALEDEVDLELSHRFGAAEVALRGLQSMAKDEACPDIILLDISLPGISGTDAIASFAACCPDAKIIMLTQSTTRSCRSFGSLPSSTNHGLTPGHGHPCGRGWSDVWRRGPLARSCPDIRDGLRARRACLFPGAISRRGIPPSRQPCRSIAPHRIQPPAQAMRLAGQERPCERQSRQRPHSQHQN